MKKHTLTDVKNLLKDFTHENILRFHTKFKNFKLTIELLRRYGMKNTIEFQRKLNELKEENKKVMK